MRDVHRMEKIFEENPDIEGVIHFAAKKSVSESCQDPFGYYDNNIVGSNVLYQLMDRYDIKRVIFSSSATVYDAVKNLPPFVETDILNTTNPYGTTKLVGEKILKDLSENKEFSALCLRYFNPVGAHHTGLLGENPEYPSNLLPVIFNIVNKKSDKVKIYGKDYETPDGTGVRDYIHVMDIAEAHLSAYQYLLKQESINRVEGSNQSVYDIFNLGTGEGTSVLQMIELVEKVIGLSVPYEVVARRSGDVALSTCNPAKTQRILDRTPSRTLWQAIQDQRNFIQKNQ